MVAISQRFEGANRWLDAIQNRLKKRIEKPKTVPVEIIGPKPRVETWVLEEAEKKFPIQARYLVPTRKGKPTVMYCVFESGSEYYPIPLDRKEALLTTDPEEPLEKVSANTTQLFHMEKQTVRRMRYSRKGSAMQKVQATMYVCLAGGLAFLLFIIFSEVTDGAN